jgi:hypothetical protein
MTKYNLKKSIFIINGEERKTERRKEKKGWVLK